LSRALVRDGGTTCHSQPIRDLVALPRWGRARGKGGDAMSAHDDDVAVVIEADFARAKPFKGAFPEQYQSWKRVGRPRVERPKVHRLSPCNGLVGRIRAAGRVTTLESRRCCGRLLRRGSCDAGGH
jgi:hypothetical protein